MDQHQPRTLGDASCLSARLMQVHSASHIAPLNEWVQREAAKRRLSIPWFDPGDAGTEARVMFLLESPGPMSDAGKGSGIISVDNDDLTAANLWSLRRDAGLADNVAVHWNGVPWYLGSVTAPTESERKRGIGLLKSLLPLFPNLEVVVPMGNAAKQVWAMYCIEKPNNLAVVPTWHPSGRGIAAPGRRAEVERALRTVAFMTH